MSPLLRMCGRVCGIPCGFLIPSMAAGVVGVRAAQAVIQGNPGRHLRSCLCLNLSLLVTLANNNRVAQRSKLVLQRVAAWFELDIPPAAFRL